MPEPDEDTPPPDAGTGTVDTGTGPDAGAGSAEPDAGGEATDCDAAPHGEIPAIPDSSCGCSSAANGLNGLFALPLLLVRPRRRRCA